jgi:hypothetical protein
MEDNTDWLFTLYDISREVCCGDEDQERGCNQGAQGVEANRLIEHIHIYKVKLTQI